jgi:hypothetical protein
MAALDLSEREQARTRDARYRDRRVDERIEINIPGGCLNYQGSKYPCLIVDVSLSGCCVRTKSTFLPGNLANVEIELPLLGMMLHMVGTTQWLTRSNLIGIRFFHANSRSKNQLAGLLTGLVDQSAVEDVRAAVVEAARLGRTALDVELPECWMHDPKPAPLAAKAEEAPAPASAAPPTNQKAWRSKDGSISDQSDKWPAVIRFLKDSSHQKGVIVDLSPEGCSVHISGTFAASIHLRVEVDFQMRGLPFLLAGVTEDVYDKHTIDIRFLDMSYRKKQELAELIAELREEADRQSKAASGS